MESSAWLILPSDDDDDDSDEEDEMAGWLNGTGI